MDFFKPKDLYFEKVDSITIIGPYLTNISKSFNFGEKIILSQNNLSLEDKINLSNIDYEIILDKKSKPKTNAIKVVPNYVLPYLISNINLKNAYKKHVREMGDENSFYLRSHGISEENLNLKNIITFYENSLFEDSNFSQIDSNLISLLTSIQIAKLHKPETINLFSCVPKKNLFSSKKSLGYKKHQEIINFYKNLESEYELVEILNDEIRNNKFNLVSSFIPLNTSFF